MKDCELISIVMPTYNSKKYIGESIESILNQTYKNFEFIIVDGHSTDGTLDIIESYRKKDDRIRVVLDEKKGIGAALRYGCSLAKGELIARMDADDIAYPERLETEIEFLQHNPEYILITSSAEYIDENGNSLGFSFPYTSHKLLKKNVQSILHPGVVFRKEAYLKAGGYQPIIRAEDYFLWNRMKNFGKFKVLKYPLVKYRVTDEALSNTIIDSFNGSLHQLYNPFIAKQTLSDNDIIELNNIIKRYLKKTETKRHIPVRKSEMFLFKSLCRLLPKKKSFSIVFFLKNIYGLFFLKTM